MKLNVEKKNLGEPGRVDLAAAMPPTNTSVALFEKVRRISLYVLAFLIPLWFLPITQNILDFPKQVLLIAITLIAMMAWLTEVMKHRELNIRMNWIHIPVLAVVLISGISTIFSVWRYGSFWGWPLDISDSFISTLFFAIMYFLVSSTVKSSKELFKLLFAFIIGAGIAGIYIVLQLYHAFLLPFAFAKDPTFNTIGSVNSMAILAAILLPLVLAMAIVQKKLLKYWLWFFAGVFLVIMLLANFFVAWLVLVMGLLAFLAFGMLHSKNKSEFGWISLPLILLIISSFFLVFQVSFFGAPSSSVEIFPSRSVELNMALNVMKKNLLLGTGPGTFVYDYVKYYPPAINQTIFWGLRFTSGASEIMDWFITKGLLGGVALIFLIITSIILGVRMLIRSDDDYLSWMVKLGLVTAFLGVVTSQILYYSNFTLLFIFWLLLGSIGMLVVKSEKKILLASSPILVITSSFIFFLILICSAGLLFIGGKKYIAEVQYFKGAQLISSGNLQRGTAKILSVAKLNPSVDLYWRDLAQLYLSTVNQITQDSSLSQDQKKQQSQVAVANAIASANRAVEINPANIENWNVKGYIYRNLIGIQGADVIAIESYNKVISLEPSSPYGFTELGRVYFTQAQNLATGKDTTDKQQEAINKALENFNKAIALKADYAPANYLIALIYSEQGKSDEAISKLNEAVAAVPGDLGLVFQLGVLYYQNNKLDNAQAEFEQANVLNPDYANARFMLGVIYDKQGKKKSAIGQFEKVLQLNPGNDQVQKIIDNLTAGKSALTGIQPTSPPIDENPPEIQSKTKK